MSEEPDAENDPPTQPVARGAERPALKHVQILEEGHPLQLQYGDYGHAVPEHSPRAKGFHFAAGAGSWVALISASLVAIKFGFDPIPALLLLTLGFVGLLTLGFFLSARYGWRTFTPGLWVGLALTCLVPLGIIGVLCFGSR